MSCVIRVWQKNEYYSDIIWLFVFQVLLLMFVVYLLFPVQNVIVNVTYINLKIHQTYISLQN